VDVEERGNAGIEKSLDGDLRGIAGRTRVLTDVHRRGIESRPSAEARAGLALTLSIDQRIQFVAEQALAAAVQEAHARTGSVVVLNPHTGDVLAIASYPGYDPGQPPQPDEDPAARFNHAVSVPFEPGSVFKVITVAAALETTTLGPESPIDCGRGALTVYGRTIHEAKNFYGTIPMAMVLAKSSNIGAIKIGLRVGQERMHEYVRRFGFGQRTGIALPAESAGKVRKTAYWSKTSLHSVSMGQELSTTTLQLAQAGAVMANGGLLVKPRLVIRRGNQVVPVEPPRRVIRPETAIAMRRMMEGVVLHGTGTRARLAGYTSGGKTGSAQIFDVKTNRFTHSYNASYMGFAPVANPAIVAVVTINGTHGSGGFGGAVAAPVFRVVAGEALRVLDVPKDLPERGAVELAQAGEDELNDLAIAQIGPLRESVLEEDAAEDGAPPVLGVKESRSRGVAGMPAVVAGPRVPNFQGKTMRVVLEEAFTAGVGVLPAGSGIARAQDPRPGAMLRPGERVRVQFAR
jgi:cell division protein FtsI (penicillin-binding protein 3)